MDSIAEITTLSQTLYVRFDDKDLDSVGLLNDELVELADQGMVYGINFGTVQ